MPAMDLDGVRLRRILLVILAIAISLLFLWMIRDFLQVLLLAALAAGAVYPFYRGLRSRLGGRTNLAAAITVFLIVMLVVIPFTAFATIVAQQAVDLGQTVGPWLRSQVRGASDLEGLVERFPTLTPLLPYRAQIYEKLGEVGSTLGGIAVGWVTQAARGAVTFLLLGFVMLYALFFFLIGGRTVLQKILYYLPLPAADEEKMVNRFLSVARATVKGTFVVGFAQGGLGGLGFWGAGIPSAALWGTLMGVVSIIPGLGPVLVWLPAVVFLFLSRQTGAAFGLLVWCIAVVGTVDNLLRPWLVGKDAKMSDLLILLSTLGGIVMFGPVGFIIGPIVAALFVTIWDIYGEAFRDVLPEAAPISVAPTPPKKEQ